MKTRKRFSLLSLAAILPLTAWVLADNEQPLPHSRLASWSLSRAAPRLRAVSLRRQGPPLA